MTDLVVVGDIRNDSAEILFQSFLQEALVSVSELLTRTTTATR